jgi:hypothetical protein
MTPNHRDELLHILAELRRLYPNWRLGQLISNVSGWADQNAWDIEDREMLAAVEEHLQVLAQRSHEVQT